ncbi:hypothetical protein PGTUg99_037234 [Puccinia graminis f. sp. tritici]|uniref:Uncharacterized protein n=1 Tax=Puccinia graminis f. sp. tritici TaxID=56615 RepID=A0A5B0QWE0_PUCGR|nr:hypothetical protein PGTUg99_037234 [Puccinia graminis f. sp. tritici]
MNVFAHRVPSKDGAALPDIADNLYAPGQSHAAYNPDTGTKRPDLIKASLFLSARGSTHQGGNGGFQHDNHQSRRRDTRRFGRGNGPDQWGNFNYGFQNQGYDGSNYGYNHQYNNQQPSYNHQNRQQFNVKTSKRIIPDSPPESPGILSSDLSLIPSDSETDRDLLANQVLAPPKEGNVISSAKWTPIATSNTPRTGKQKTKKRPSKTEPTKFPEWTPDISTYLSKKPKPKRIPRKKKTKGS